MKQTLLFAAALVVALTGCRGRVLTPAELAGCDTLPPVELVASLLRVRVNAPAPISATGGSGHFRFGVQEGGSGGQVRGDRFVAGATPATDTLFVEDLVCGTRDEQALEVVAAFDAAPTRAIVPPATSFQLQVAGLLGSASFALAQNQSGGTLSATGLYTAGASEGVDLVDVTDAATGDQAQLQFTVRAAASFRAEPDRMAVPAGSAIQLSAVDGTDRVQWRKVSGPGEISQDLITFEEDAAGTAVVEAFDPFLNRTSTAQVRVLDELDRETRPHGRLLDVATMVTADFNGDGFEDLAVGVPESDLGDAVGGAVLFYLGSAQGFVEAPAWRILGTVGATLGAALAVGDINEDGRPDLAVGAPGADVTVADSGGVYLYRFDASGPVLLRRPLSGTGPARYGSALALADVDGDGDVDLVVGAPRGDLVNVSTGRGTVDVFFFEAGTPILDNPNLRLSGWDLDPDGTAVHRAQTRAGGALTVGDFNGDGRNDLAVHGTITNRLLDTVALAGAQPGFSVFFGRPSSTQPWAPAPDLVIAPRDPADTTEGNLRLDFLAGNGARPPLLAVLMDRANSPDLRASGGRNAASDAGGAFLFDLSGHAPTGTPAAKPVQLGRGHAHATFFGSVAGTVAGRSWAFADVNGIAGPELVLGVPYVSATVDGQSVRLSGRAIAFNLGVAAGTVTNVPILERDGSQRSDCFGAGMVSGSNGLFVFSSRATTELGDFTGRVDLLQRGSGGFVDWQRTPLSIPARAAEEGFALSLAGGRNAQSVPVALVGAPGFDGPGVSNDGNDLNAGRAYQALLGNNAPMAVAAEGAASPNVRGGREVGAGVAFTDFDGDGRQDLVIGAPNLARPSTNNRAADITPHYTSERAECLGTASPTTGGVMVHLGLADGSFRPAFRLWADATISGCTGSGCTRTGIGRAVAGAFDFNGDDRQDLLATRSNGAELYLGRAPDDSQLAKLSMGCDPQVTVSFAQAASAPTAVGDLDGDGCDEVAVRSATTTTSNVAILFGYDPGGARCGGKTSLSSVTISDRDAGVQFLGLGSAVVRAGRFLNDGKDYLAVSASSYPVRGVDQDAVLLYEVAAIVARRPASGNVVVGGIVDLTPVPLVLRTRVRGFGRALVGSVELTGDGAPELVVGAPEATIVGSESPTGAVYVLRGGRAPDALQPLLQVVGDRREAGQFGAVLSFAPGGGGVPPQLLIGAPQSYRRGVRHGTAFALPVGF